MTFISIAGVAVGVMALIVVLAVMNGFQNELRERILGITSHVVVTSLRGSMSDYRDLLGQIKSEPEVVAATPYLYAQVMVSSQRGLAGAVVRGLDPKTAGEVINIARNLKEGKLTLPLILVRDRLSADRRRVLERATFLVDTGATLCVVSPDSQ